MGHRIALNIWVLIYSLALAVFGSSFAFAQNTPQKLNISGALYGSSGAAITSASVDFKIELLDASGTCVLYSENHNAQNLQTSKGGFSLEIGSGTSPQNFLESPSTALSYRVFKNSGATGAFAGCGSGVTLTPGSQRLIRVFYNLGSGLTQLSPDVPISSASYAMVADTLQGLTPSELIQVKDDALTDLNQTNVETVFSSTNYSKLLELLNQTFSADFSFNNRKITNVGAPVAGTDAVNKDWTDAHVGSKTADLAGVAAGVGDGKTLIWDATLNKWTTGTPAATDATKLPLAGGVMTGAISMGGYDINNTGNIYMANQKYIQLSNVTNAQEAGLALGAGQKGAFYFNPDLDTVRLWNGTGYVGFSPTGAAGGDLTGTYPNPTVANSAIGTVKIANDAISSAKIDNGGAGVINRLVSSDPTTGTTLKFVGCALNEVMKFDAAGRWSCTTVQALIGNSGVTAGAYGSATTVPRFGVNALGAVTMATDVAINFPVTSVAGKTGAVTLNAADVSGLGTAAVKDYGTAAGNLVELDAGAKIPAGLLPATVGDIGDVTAGTGLTGGGSSGAITVSLANTAVTAGSYGSASTVPNYTVDAQGRLTFAQATNIAIPTTSLTQTSAASGQFLKWNGSLWLASDLPVSAGDISDVNVGTGLTGGGVSGSVTVSLADTSVTAGSYGSATTVPNYTVDAQGRLTFAQATAIAIPSTAITQTNAASGQVLKWNGSLWLAADDNNAGGDITDVSVGSGLTGGGSSGAITVSLANTAVTAGSYGSASTVPNYTVDAQGRLTFAQATNIAIATTALTQTNAASGQFLKWNGSLWLASDLPVSAGDISDVNVGTGLTGGGVSGSVTVSLADTSVTAGSYGSATTVPNYTVDAQGRLTFAQATTIAIPTTAITQTNAASGQVLKWNGSLWLAADDSNAGGDITDVAVGSGLTGGGSSGAITVSLANTAVTAGSYGSASTVPNYTVDAQGRLTFAQSTAIQIPGTSLTQTGATSGQVLKWNGSLWLPGDVSMATGDISDVNVGTGLTGGGTTGNVTVSLADTSVTAGSYGSASTVPNYTVDAQGRLTFAQATTIAIPSTAITQTNAASGQVLKWNGSLWLAADDNNAGGDITDVSVGLGLTGGGSSGAITVSLANTAVTAGSYGSASTVPNYTVDAQGRLTFAQATTIAIPTTAITQTSAASGQTLKWNGSLWLPADDNNAGGDITDVSVGSGLTGGGSSGNVTVSLANTAVTAGSYGSASTVPNYTVDAQGRLTFAQSTAIQIPGTSLTQTGAQSGQVLKWNGSLWLPGDVSMATGDISDVNVGTGLTGGGTTGNVTLSLANTSVTAGSYGSATTVPNYTVDAQGRLTFAQATSIAIPSTAITQTNAASGQVLKWNGSLWLAADDNNAGGDITDVNVGSGLTGGGTSGNVTVSLANTSVTAGSYGSASTVPNYTVDAQGRLTFAQSTAIQIPGTSLTQTGATAGQVLKWNGSLWLPGDVSAATGDISDVNVGTGLTGGGTTGNVTVSLANTSVTAGSYGSASTVPNYTVDAQGRLTFAQATSIAIASTAITQTNAASGQVLKWNGSLWLPADDTNAGGDITDVSVGSGLTGGGSSGNVTVSLANTTVTAGSYGSASTVPNYTVDAQGRLTFAQSTAIQIPGTSLTQTGATSGQVLKWNGSLWLPGDVSSATGDISDVNVGTGLTGGGTTGNVTVSLANTSVTAGSYGSATTVPNYTVDAQGRLTFAQATAIAIPATAITQTSAASGQTLKWNGSLWLPADDSNAGGDITDVSVGSGLTGGGASGNVTVSLSNTAVTAGSYGSASTVPNYTVDAQGRLTFAQSTNIAIATTALTQTNAASGQFLKWNGSLWLASDLPASSGDISDVNVGTGLTGGGTTGNVTVSLANTSVTAGSYGSATTVPNYTVDAQGRLTFAQATSIAIPATAITQTSAASGQTLKWNGSLWLPADDNNAGGDITAVTAGTGISGGGTTGAVTINLASTAVTAGSYGSATTVPNYTVDAYGRLTFAQATAIAIPGTSLTQTGATSGQVLKWNGSLWLPGDVSTATGDISDVNVGTGLTGGGTTGNVTVSLANTSVTAGSYGSASTVPNYTVDAQGRLTFAQATNIAIATTALTQTNAASGQFLKWNGSLWLASDLPASSGDISDVNVGTGLTGGGTTGNVTVSLANTSVTAGSYGSATTVPNYTVDAQGRLTFAQATSIAIPSTAITQTNAASGQVLKWNGSLWLAADDNNAGGDITAVTAGTGISGGGTSGTVTINLASTAVTAGSYGSATTVPNYTVDAYGRLTFAQSTSIAIPTTSLTQTSAASGQFLKWNGSLWLASDLPASSGDISDVNVGTGLTGGGTTGNVTVSLANTSVTAGSYGSATTVPNYTVDAYGRLTFAQATSIAIPSTAITQTNAASGQVLKWNGSLWLAADDNNAGGDITAVTAGTGISGGGTSGTVTINLASTAVTAGSYGSATTVPNYTVDAYGRLTFAQATTIAIPSTAITQTNAASGQVLKWNGSLWLAADDANGGGDITAVTAGTGISGGGTTGAVTINLASTAVTAGSYGSATTVPNYTVDAYGRLTFAQATSIAIPSTAITQTNAASGQVLTWNGSLWLPAAATAVTADTLDFTEMKDSMLLDASTNVLAMGTNVLSITNSGTGNSFLVNDQMSDTTPFVINSGGVVGIGTSSPEGMLDVRGNVAAGATAGLAMTSFYNPTILARAASKPHLYLEDTGDSIAGMAVSPNGLTVGTELGFIEFRNNISGGAGDYTANGTVRMIINSSGQVGVGTASPTAGTTLDVTGTGTGYSSMIIPRDTTTNRPTGVNGMIRYNTTTNKFEAYENTRWRNMNGGSITYTVYSTAASAQTYTTPTDVYAIEVEVQGAGGGGGGVDGSGTANQIALAGGGGAGGWAVKVINNPAASYTYTVGAAGTAGAGLAGGTGGTGGTSSFTDGGSVNVTATGGAGGIGSAAALSNAVRRGSTGTGSGGDVNGYAPGQRGYCRWVSGVVYTYDANEGMPSKFGPGGQYLGANLAGDNAVAAGSGGGGAYVNDTVATNYAGGTGAAGQIIIKEYHY